MILCDNAVLLLNFIMFFYLIHLKYPNKSKHFATFKSPRWPTSCNDVIIVSTVELLYIISLILNGVVEKSGCVFGGIQKKPLFNFLDPVLHGHHHPAIRLSLHPLITGPLLW